MIRPRVVPALLLPPSPTKSLRGYRRLRVVICMPDSLTLFTLIHPAESLSAAQVINRTLFTTQFYLPR